MAAGSQAPLLLQQPLAQSLLVEQLCAHWPPWPVKRQTLLQHSEFTEQLVFSAQQVLPASPPASPASPASTPLVEASSRLASSAPASSPKAASLERDASCASPPSWPLPGGALGLEEQPPIAIRRPAANSLRFMRLRHSNKWRRPAMVFSLALMKQ
jgi:hypothetical protein